MLAAVLVIVFTSCSANDNVGQGLSIMETESSKIKVPEKVINNPPIDGESARYLGELSNNLYFVARSASAPEQDVCLVQYEASEQDVKSACSSAAHTPGGGKIVTLETADEGPEFTLVSDSASQKSLQEEGLIQLGENLWYR